MFAYSLPRIPLLKDVAFCTVRRFLGVNCPGCGMKSAFIALTHGEIRASVDAHPLGIVVALWFVYQFGRALVAVIAGRWPRPLLTQTQRDILLYAFLTALIVQWVVQLLLL